MKEYVYEVKKGSISGSGWVGWMIGHYFLKALFVKGRHTIRVQKGLVGGLGPDDYRAAGVFFGSLHNSFMSDAQHGQLEPVNGFYEAVVETEQEDVAKKVARLSENHEVKELFSEIIDNDILIENGKSWDQFDDEVNNLLSEVAQSLLSGDNLAHASVKGSSRYVELVSRAVQNHGFNVSSITGRGPIRASYPVGGSL